MEMLIPTNKVIDKVLSNMCDYMNMMGNPVWIISYDSGVKREDVTNQFGLIIMKNPGGEVRREIPPPMPAYYIQLWQALLSLADTISGVHDATQGRRPVGITAAEAISTLQEAAQTRIRLKERNLQQALIQLGFLVVATMMQYYTEPRVVKITGRNEWPDYFEFWLEDSGDPNKPLIANMQNFVKTDRGYERKLEINRAAPSRGLFDIEVTGGTSLPFQKEKRGTLARELYKAKVIDEEDLLDALEWPNKEKALRKIEQRKIQESQQPQPQAG